MLTLTMVLITCGTALALTGAANLGNSNPAWISTSTKGVWSSAGYWDTRNNTSIPNNATVTGMQVTWTVTPTTGWAGMHLALLNGSGNYDFISSSGTITINLMVNQQDKIGTIQHKIINLKIKVSQNKKTPPIHWFLENQ